MKYTGYVLMGVRLPVEVEGANPEEAVAEAYQQYPSLVEGSEPLPVAVNLEAGDGTATTRDGDCCVFLTDEQGNEYADDRVRILEAKLADQAESRARAEQLLLTIIHSRPGHCVTLTEESFTQLPDHPRLHQQNNQDGSFVLRVIDIPPIDPSNLVQ